MHSTVPDRMSVQLRINWLAVGRVEKGLEDTNECTKIRRLSKPEYIHMAQSCGFIQKGEPKYEHSITGVLISP